MVWPGIMRKFTVTLAFWGSTLAAGEPLAIVTPVVVRIKDAAGGICFITSFSTGRSSHRLHSTTRPG